MVKKDIVNTIQSIFEARYLKRINRSGTSLLLGSEIQENVVEHSFYSALFALVLHELNSSINLEKLLTLCLIHDLEEVRTGDINQINRFYQKSDNEVKAFTDMWTGSTLGKKFIKIHKEGHDGKTQTSKYFKDCDLLSELILEKEYLAAGNKEAEEWMEFTIQRISTKEGKLIAKIVISERFSSWWEKIKNNIRKRQGIPIKRYQ